MTAFPTDGIAFFRAFRVTENDEALLDTTDISRTLLSTVISSSLISFTVAGSGSSLIDPVSSDIADEPDFGTFTFFTGGFWLDRRANKENRLAPKRLVVAVFNSEFECAWTFSFFTILN